MRGGLKTLVAALAVLLIAVGLVACGGSDSPSSTSTEAGQGETESKSSQDASKQDSAKSDDGKSGSGGEGKSGSSSPSASDFTPKQHNDSGGGSAPLRTKGGDNSVQEFGEEADTSEFDAAAEAVHNFLDARAEGNWAAACAYMSKGVVESFEKLAAQAKQVKDSCAGILEALTNPAARGAMKAEAEKANVRSLRTEGERAFVIYTGTDGTVLAMPMANEDGDWKVASLAGTPLS